jgi:hypothetical protein
MAKEPLTADRIRTFVKANQGMEFGTLDLLTKKGDLGLDWADLHPEDDRAAVQTYQRLAKIHPDLDVAERLISKGLVSANHVARIPRQAFIAEHAGDLGLDDEQAESIHKRATAIRNKTMHLWASVRGTVASPFFSDTRLDTVSDEVKQTFQGLPSYQELFGSLDYCACEECHSIFGAAAYLVDLLRIIDEYVTKPNLATITAINSEFLFNARRPDIELISLTCAKTTTLVPYLQIVNERLIARAQKTLGESADVIKQMATTLVYPRALPFNALLDQIRVLLDKVGVSYGTILAAWKALPTTVAARSLGFSPEQQTIVTTPLTTAETVAPYYNVAAADITTLSDADTFLAKTWSTFEALLTLVNQDLSPAEQDAGLQVNFFINQGLKGKWIALKQKKDSESYVLTNLNVAATAVVALDQINRLLRVADVVGQTAQAVDWALRCVQGGGAPVITNDALTSLFQLTSVGANLSLSFSAATVLMGPIKTYGQGVNGEGAPFDLLFNTPALVVTQGSYHPSGNPLNLPGYKDTPFPWTPGSNSAANVAAINRVLPGLGLSLPDANALGSFLYGTAQHLTVQVLSVLYRHALLSSNLQLPMSSYLVFLSLIGLKDKTAPTATELGRMVAAGQWINKEGISVYQLDYVINGNGSVYVNPMYQPDTVVQWLQGVWASVPASSPTAAHDITTQVSVLFGASSTLTEILLTMSVAAVPLPAGATTWVEAFLTADSDGKTPKYGDYVQEVLKWMSRWLVLSQSLNLSEPTLANVAAYPAAYHLSATFAAIPWSAIKDITLVQNMMQDYGDLQRNLLAYIKLASTNQPQEDQLAALQKATGWNPDEVKQLLAGPVKGVTVLTEQLAELQNCFVLLNNLGANPGLMETIAALGDAPATSWAQYVQTASTVLAKVASRYGSRWATIWGTLSGILAVHERDALLALVLSELNTLYPDIKAPRNVYEFLLTDVEMGASTQVSYILEALNAAQLYLQRCRLRLEPGVIDMTQIQDAWWEWMMNYRIWEANREIFVYPENYLIPTLRRNVSQQFATLSQSLQQSDVTKSYVGAAFKAYIDGFSEVAQLKPVDAYRTRIHDTDTLYLLARTKTGPYTFYYCSQAESMPWTPWEKIDLSINSPTCTIVYAFNRPFLFWNEIKKNNTSSVAGTTGNVSTTNSTAYTASVMYSFLNQQGKWVQPQTLVNQDTILFEAEDNRRIALKDAPIFDDLFDMEDPVWNKVCAFNVTAENYLTAPGDLGDSERLVVLYGPNVLNTGVIVDSGTVSPTTDPNASNFWEDLHDRSDDHNLMVQGQLSGNLSLRPVSILNASLEDDVLVQRQELLLMDPYQAATPLSLVRAEMQSSGNVMQISHTGQPITDNLSGSVVGLTSGSRATTVNGHSFIGPGISDTQSTSIFTALKGAGVLDSNDLVQPAQMATLNLSSILGSMTTYNAFGPIQYLWVQKVLDDSMASTELFSKVGGLHTYVAPVSTQPGWFLFFTADEVFLLSPRPVTEGTPVFSTFVEGLTIADPLITPMFAVMSYMITVSGRNPVPKGINANVSQQIFEALVGFSLITSDGRLAQKPTVAILNAVLANLILIQKIITADQVPYIYLALINAPTIFSDAFIGDNIKPSTSSDIYTALQGFSIIDPNGRIDQSILIGAAVQAALANMLLNNKITQQQIAGIYSILAHAPKAVALTYTNQGNATGLTDISNFVFDVTRLSTGAIRKVSRALFVGGVDTLLDLRTQQIPVTPVQPFARFKPSTHNLNWPSALDATQVDFDGLYGQYYWEIFYHIPTLVAYSLSTNQQYAEAQTWLQYIFDPTVPEQFVTAAAIVSETAQAISQQQAAGIITQLQSHKIGETPAPILNTAGEVNPDYKATTDLSFLKTADPSLTDTQVLMTSNILLNYQLHGPASQFWLFRPFRNHTLETLVQILSDNNPAVKVYNDDPFDPFAIARLRVGAFEKSTLMQYVDCLIAWGDQLFTQDTWESITAAYMLYVYTYDLLGQKPEQVGVCPGADLALTFKQIKDKYPDGIPQFLIDLEYFIPKTGVGTDTAMQGHAFNDLYVYFCVPENTDLVNRWDTIQDRMYKINNSMNIEGVFRVLPLFQPPINPLDLVKAAAAGNNVQAFASSQIQPSPFRYSSAIAAAFSLCSTLIELGNSLLSVLEKSDAEGLSALRTNQEGQILEMMTQIKQDRLTELQATIQSLNFARTGATNRLTFYTNTINSGLNSYENANLSATDAALTFTLLSSISKTAAAIGYAIPQVGSPFAMTYGGVQVGSVVNATSGVFEIGAEISNFIAQRALTMGGYKRRAADWVLQQQLAQADVSGLDQQITAANLQLQSAQQDLAVHKKSIAQNQVMETYLTNKFTNQDLYQWMVGRLAATYFQTYALALQAARQAETAYQFELDSSKTFLSFDYWDSLHKGLTAGEGLRLALNRLDDAYRSGDTRRLEVERVVSLALIAPDQLLALKSTGNCTFSLSEALFDYDYPGQYARKIKTISISIPASVGPYQNIKAILTQTKNSVVTDKSAIDAVKFLLNLSQTQPSSGLRQNWAQNQSIAISRGVDDSGLFVLDFQDPRYLPFENTGAVSEWQLEMPLETNRFDFEQLSDVLITVRYTALYDGTLETKVRQALGQAPLKGGVYVNADMQSAAWQAFLTNHTDTTKQKLTLTIDPSQIGYFKSLTYKTVILQLDVGKDNTGQDIKIPTGATFLSFLVGSEPVQSPPLSAGQGTVDSLSWNGKTLPSSWNFTFNLKDPNIASLLTDGFIDGTKLLNMQVIVLYEAKVF